MTEISRSKGTKRSSTHGPMEIDGPGLRERGDLALALAVVAKGGGLEHAGAPMESSAASQFRRARATAANGAIGMPAPARNCFSRSRCWQMWRTLPGGPDGAMRRGPFDAADRDVLELERQHIDARRRRPRPRPRSS